MFGYPYFALVAPGADLREILKTKIMPEKISASGRRPNLIHWYYNESIHGIFEIWKNFLLFFWRYFSISKLFKTLFSPWHRDVSLQSWRGFHPGKMLGLFIENLFSRLIGSVVRMFVIILGLITFISAAILGLLAVFIWIGMPIIVVFIFYYSFANPSSFLYSGPFLLFWAAISAECYFLGTKKPVIAREMAELTDQPVFSRICGRLGISQKRFPKDMLSNVASLDDFLRLNRLTKENLSWIINWETYCYQAREDAKKFWKWQNLKKIKPIGLEWCYGYTIKLDRYSQDLSKSDYSEYFKTELIGRKEEYELLKLILNRPDENCVLIVGNEGIGKKTLFHFLARNIRQRNEMGLENVRILLLDLGRAISEAINQGEDVENFLRMIFYEAGYAGNVVLVIEHLENFLGKNESAFHPDISAVLSEYLELPTFQVIATSTTKEYHDLIEKHDQVTKYFEVIEMREPSENETIEILLKQIERYEKEKVLFTYKALETIVLESGKYKWEFPLPERALDLAMDTLMFWEKNSNDQFISEKTVNDCLSLKTGIPHGEIAGGEQKKLLDLENNLHRQVIGQEEAVNQVAEALRRARSGIGNSEKPVGSFIFLGPTGVGKTETAKALAKTYFGDELKMVRLDMSEFQAPNSIDRLLGSSNLNQQGRLVTAIKDNPFSLILLDEIEKAYPDILDIFLQILDEGFVTDAFGEKVNFRNTIIIATSNAGASLIKNMIEERKPAEEIKQAVIDYAIEKNIFRTEFLNRFDGVIFFRPLDGNELRSVARLQLQKFARKIAKEKNIEIAFNDDVIEKIIQKGYNPIFGARSLNRYIEEEVESLVAKKIISGEAKNGEKIDISL